MKLAIFDDMRVGVVSGGGIVDVSEAVPKRETGFGTPFWIRMCRDFSRVRPAIEELVREKPPKPLAEVTLRCPVLNPRKILAAAANFTDHVNEMTTKEISEWMLDFDVFLKAPSSLAAPNARILLPNVSDEIHYEAELAVVIGEGGRHIRSEDALKHVLGYTILIDMTVRGRGDRSRRKSYDGFTPIGPWLVTADEVERWEDLHIQLWLNDELRQDVVAGDMLKSPSEIISYASSVMTLEPGDVISTGAPPGVGAVARGDRLRTEISGLGVLHVSFG